MPMLILIPSGTIRGLAVVCTICVATTVSAFQTLEVPATGVQYDADPGASFDPLESDPPAETRIAREAARISELAGTEVGDAITPLLATLFNSSKSDAERLQAAADLRQIAEGLNIQDPAQRSVASQILRRTRLAEAAIGALARTDADEQTRETVNDLLLRTSIDFEHANRLAHTEIARTLYDRVRKRHPQIYTSIQPVYVQEYFNYNLHFVISEPLLSRMVSDYRCERGSVADCILGAWVTGSQVTDTKVRADIRPSLNSAAFDIVVDGRTVSNTQGRKHPAVIYTRGNHPFNIVKTAYFDGTRLSGSPANMDVRPNNQTVGASTKFDRVPILGKIARNIAFNEAVSKKPESDAIAAKKMAMQALPQFEREIAGKFQEANENLQNNLLANLRKRGIEPSQYSARSSETHLALSSRTVTVDALAAPLPPSTPAPSHGVAVQMHESAMNAAIESLDFSGQMSVAQVIGRIEEALEELVKKEVDLRKSGAQAEDKTEFDFEPRDGIRVRFEQDQVVFVIRTGFYQTAQDRRIPRHSFEIPVGIEIRDGELMLIPPPTDTKGIVAIRPQAIEGRSSIRSVVQARTIAKELLDKTFQNGPVKVDPNLDLTLGDGSTLRLRLTEFQMTDGWITAVLE